jgi:hypothetical protein
MYDHSQREKQCRDKGNHWLSVNPEKKKISIRNFQRSDRFDIGSADAAIVQNKAIRAEAFPKMTR